MTVIEMKPVRERILDTAMNRYYVDGIRAVSADALIAEARVSKATFYRHFPHKDDLVIAYLELQSATEQDSIQEQRAAHPGDPAAVLTWYADTIGAFGCSPGFRGCPFINAAAELSDPEHRGRKIVAEHRAWLTAQVAELLAEMGIEDAVLRADHLMMLRDGAMVAGYVGSEPADISSSLVAAGRTLIAR
ncbi:TetR/AcrR family transcriptional regulator [Aeromicrobium sp.]|uniref:TetR/AcrR family transcriptional regulator n=1 Tax=Aeromicrobium sp. TaxID=1871063 RepID=UPI0019CCDD46|nr:TetR/AcrR family transcriptional regulator [Aeromicrobium sp.]MBC7632657.1 TetR/AcrR family transcriptional regulator [Aeromicrobium sp.]